MMQVEPNNHVLDNSLIGLDGGNMMQGNMMNQDNMNRSLIDLNQDMGDAMPEQEMNASYIDTNANNLSII